MSRNLNPFREMRLSSILTILACLSLCGFSVYRAMDGQPILMTSAVIASESKGIQQPGDALSSKIFGPESPILTKAAPAYSTVRLTPIEELQVGDRVRADSPTSDLDLEFGPEVVSERWRKLSLLAPKRDGTTADVVLLRPLFWLNEQKAEVGGTVYISVPECGIDGHAKVLSIEPCPEIVPGEGRVITGTFRHQATSGISLKVTGQSDPIRCTGNHPVWSETHQKFVRADSLQIAESLRTATGIAHVRDISLLPGLTPVFNLEIHGLHVYHVGTAGVLVHNGDPEDCIKWAQGMRDQIDGEVVHMLPGNGAPVIGKLPGYDAVRIQDGIIPGWKQHAIIIKDGKIFDAVHPNGIPAGEWFGKYMELNGFKSVTEMLEWVRFQDLMRGFTG